MISLQHTPGPVNLLGDEVKLAFMADGRWQSAGAKAQCSFYNSTSVNMQSSHWLELTWKGITERFLFNFGGAGTSGNDCQILTTSNASTWMSTHLAEAFRANYNIARDFDVNTTSGTQCTLTARTKKATGLAIVQKTGTSGVSFSVSNQGADPIYRSGYAIIVQTYVRTANGVTTLVNEDRLTPDANGYAEADFGELLKGYVTPTVSLSNTGDIVIKRTGMVCTFWFRYGEVWDGDYQRLYTTEEYKGVWGGLSTAAKRYVDYDMGDWYALVQYDKLFLNNLPAWVPTTPNAPQRLYWMCMESGLGSVNIYAKSWNIGGVNEQLVGSISAPEKYMIYELNTSYQRMVNNGWAAPNDLRYEITVRKTNGTILAGPQGYWIDRKSYRHERYVLFRNSLGGFDTLIAKGLKQTTLQIDRYITEYDSTGKRQAWLNEANQEYELNSGSLRPDYKAYLAELMLSTHVVLVETGKPALQIIITDSEMNQATDDEQRPTLTFSFTNVAKDKFYSKYF